LKRVIKVSAGFGGKVPTGSYQNMSPSFYAEETFEVDDGTAYDSDGTIKQYAPPPDINTMIVSRQKELQAICYQNFVAEAERAKILKIQGDRKDFRWYPAPNGEQFISVTSILNYDTNFLIDEDELKQYASQGNIIHAQVAEFIKTGEWKNPKDIEGTGPDLFILKSGSLKLALDGWDFPAFLKKYPLEGMQNGFPVLSLKHRYGGTPDLDTCLYEGVPTLPDVKRTPDKVKNFMQMAAYEMARREMGFKQNQQMMIIPLNDKTDQGFSKPIISKDIEKYFELFLYKRKEFKRVYGV